MRYLGTETYRPALELGSIFCVTIWDEVQNRHNTGQERYDR